MRYPCAQCDNAAVTARHLKPILKVYNIHEGVRFLNVLMLQIQCVRRECVANRGSDLKEHVESNTKK